MEGVASPSVVGINTLVWSTEPGGWFRLSVNDGTHDGYVLGHTSQPRVSGLGTNNFLRVPEPRPQHRTLNKKLESGSRLLELLFENECVSHQLQHND